MISSCINNHMGSSKHPCKKCGDTHTMMHTHDCGQEHWMKRYSTQAGQHYLQDCPHMHVHPYDGPHSHTDTGSITVPTQKRPPRAERIAYLYTVPWINRVRGRHVACEGWKSGKGRGHCKNTAKFSYRPLKSSEYVQKGKFCWSHLPLDYPGEHERLQRWMEKNPPPWTA